MTVMVLMAGDDAAFHAAGHRWPRNLIEVAGEPVAQHVIGRLGSLVGDGSSLVCVLRDQEDRRFHTGDVVRLLAPEATVRLVPETAGAALTALLAAVDLDPTAPLLVLNGDQVLDVDLGEVLDGFEARGLDGGIVCFESVHPRWSYVRVDPLTGLVTETAEKRPISRLATAGAYWFARTADFIEAVSTMVVKEAHVDGRYYVCPAYNEMILKHADIGVTIVSREQYHSLATPDGIAYYESQLVGR